MRTSLCQISQILCIISLLSTSNAIAQEEYLNKKATLFVNYYNKKDFSSMTDLFHFPQEYTEKELREDRNAINKTLKIYFDEFEKIKGIEKVNNPPLYYSVLIGGGNIPYWQRYPEVYNSTYKVMFSREGQGYLAFGFCNILKKWEIRQVSYGLPAESPQSRARIGDILQKCMRIIGQ
jgi:hypothetical protein